MLELMLVPVLAAVFFLLGWASGLVMGSVIAVLWAPFLYSVRVRSLFVYGPTERTGMNYAAVLLGLCALHAGLLAVLLGMWGGLTTFRQLIVVAGVGVPLLCWVMVVDRLPRHGVDWCPQGYGMRTKLVWGAGMAWYAVLTTVPPMLLAFFYYLP